MSYGNIPTGLGLARDVDPTLTAEFNHLGTAAPPVSAVGSGRIYFDSGTGKWRISESGAAYVNIVGGGGGAVTAQYTALVDPALGNDATGAFGDLGLPFQTIQAACNAVPEATNSAEIRRVYVILIASGSYDEDLTINLTRRHIALLGIGPWNLGAFGGAVANWSPSNTRNIVCNVNLGNIDSIRHSLTIGTVFVPGEGLSTHPSYNTGARISGNITINDNVLGGTTKELYFQGQVFDNGATGSSFAVGGVGGGIMNVYVTRSRFASAFGGAPVRLQLADRSRFQGLVNLNVLSRIQSSQLEGGLTCLSASADIEPSGIVGCYFAGVFTGPAGSARVDGSTYRSMRANGATLAGGATINLLEDRPSQNAVWVDAAGGSDALGIRGSASTPFLTVQAALTAAVAGDTIYIGPGTYTEALVMPAKNNLTIRGSGRSNTIITNAAAATLTWTPVAAGVTQFSMYDLTIRNTGGFEAVSLSAAAVADFLSGRAYAFGCEFIQTGAGNVMLATRANDFAFESCRFQGGPVVLREPSAFVFNSCPILGGLDVRYDDVNPTPVNGRQNVTISNGSYVGDPNVGVPASITLRGSPLFVCDRDSGSFGSLVGVGLTFFVAGPIHAPIIIYAGFLGSAFIAGTGAITLPLPAIPAAPFAPAMIVDFGGAVIAGTGLVVLTIGGAIAFTITAIQSRWLKTAVGSVSIGTLLNLDAKNSAFSAQAAFAVVGTGTLDRSSWLVLGTANPGGAFAIPYLAYPAGAALMATLTPSGVGGIIANVAAPPGAAAAAVLTSAPGGVVDLLVSR